jgi:hypothetical protein
MMGGSALLFAKGLVYYKRGPDGISKDMSDVADQCVPKTNRL